ncbi:MAG: lytic transglycosylase domain-containing protein [Thermodesulfobacteriota bacterium]|nr:lytic transglycosylase domain-containing protein [Thermodesulfobacteriota bacterium]
MELNEPFIWTGHPPHPPKSKRSGSSFPRLLLKVILFIVISFLSIHLPDLSREIRSREQALHEIIGILEKHSKDMDEGTKRELAGAIYEESLRYNHDPKFILALIAIESSFQNQSISERGAKGLMQLMPYVAESIAQELGIEWKGDPTLFNPSLNITMGIHYLSQLILDFNDIRVAMAAYNYGPTYVKGLIERKQRIPAHYYHRVITVYQTL